MLSRPAEPPAPTSVVSPVLDAAVLLPQSRPEVASAEGRAGVDAPLDADARAFRRRALLRDDPNLARAVVNLVGAADEGHAVAVRHAPDDADLLVHVAVGVGVYLPDVGLARAGGEPQHGREQHGQKNQSAT